jgi:hypothetical protein
MMRTFLGWTSIVGSMLVALQAFTPVGANAGLINIAVQDGSGISIEIQGSARVTNQVLLGILIPNNTTNFFKGTDPLGTITTSNGTFPIGASTGTGTSTFTGTGFGLGSGTGTYQGNGFWGDFASTPASPKLSDFLDPNFNNSLNGPNLNALDASLGVPSLASVTEFGVYTIAITTGPLAPNRGLNGGVGIQILSGLPQGTILVALDDNGNSTVLSGSGLWTGPGGSPAGTNTGVGGSDPPVGGTPGDPPGGSVPEPSTVLVLGSGLLGLAFMMRRRSR